jgi:long-chain fatty acid transport protein
MICILFLPRLVEASGFSVYDFGAEEQAQGNAVTAQVESPSAVFYNPSGLSDLDGIQLKVGTSILFSEITFQSDTTNADTNIEPGPFFPSYLFVTSRLNDRWSAGFGVFSAIGNKVEYPKDWEGRFFLTSSELLQLNFSPTIAYKISEKLSIGGGAVVTYATFKRANQISLAPLPGEGSLDVNADGVGVGGLIGAKLKFGASTFGVVYKSPMTITFKGDADFSVPGLAGLFFQDGDIRSTQKFPQMVIVGFAHQPVLDMTLEVDLQWTNWNSFDDQTLRFENPVLGVQEVTVPFHWKDTWTVRVGGHYDVTDAVTVRLGYVFDPSAVHEETLSPLIPELDKHIVEGGIGFQKGEWALDLFYGVIFGQSRKVDNSLPAMPIHQGTYDASGHGGGVSIRYRF